ncbi:oxoglutarate dehydrogenase (succinyl-transferring), E1 component [gamma proteobacterium HTCC5015]|nr:oxoglutarate dehydrogenase (succinyl-transferring), E1 component [gamma proteobacterium HTCC5015]
MQSLWDSSEFDGANSAYLEVLYENWLEDPDSVAPKWADHFQKIAGKEAKETEVRHSAVRKEFREIARVKDQYIPSTAGDSRKLEHERKQVRVLDLIEAFRSRGHLHAELDPLGRKMPQEVPDLSLKHHGLSLSDLDTVFDTGNLFGQTKTSLADILEVLNETYCGPIGSEVSHVVDSEERRWLQQRLESSRGQPNYSGEFKKYILERMTAAEGLERYLHTKYVGQKRFSLEGGEALIPMLDLLVQDAGRMGMKETVIGMAHRGRLNVLVNIMGKNPADLFQEFEGHLATESRSGDVKYHMGFSSDIKTDGGTAHLALAFNPSHLEIVAPVVEGSVRARQDRRGDGSGSAVLPINIHGDAAFAGQGVVMETFNMSQSRGFSTKGTVHIVINNQIGFTTSNQKDTRSTYYCTDVAKMVNAPIFHVNGDNPEAVCFVTQLALEYRTKFKKDVVIDLICYRRHGHNEADEPSATQPRMYSRIKALETTRTLYAKHLIGEGVITEEEDREFVDGYRDKLDRGECAQPIIADASEDKDLYEVDWEPFLGKDWDEPCDTRVDLNTIKSLNEKLLDVPEGHVLHSRVQKILEDRRKMGSGAMALDWGFAETMAYATLVTSWYPVRLTGQDSGRGTFFHRHAVLHHQEKGTAYVPLRHLAKEQANFLVIDSLLSEEAVLAFEYGYATSDPHSLVIWEAQFGDFANGAQVVIDQFISSGEQKWGRLCGLTMLLPHGYEGQGPEHSSARLERFLQLCAEHNIQVCYPTTPSQIFHLLRRQAIRPCRKPLIVMTPKSLLRHKRAVSSLDDLAEGAFMPILGDSVLKTDPNQVKRIVFCSGKIFYDLLEYRESEQIEDVAIVRIEQLYPFPEALLRYEVDRYFNAEEFVWCQEEPMNQGAWYSIQHHIRAMLDGEYLHYAGRSASASPAVGSAKVHVQQQKQLVQDAFSDIPNN